MRTSRTIRGLGVHGLYRVGHAVLRLARVFGIFPRGAFVAVWCGNRILLIKTTYQPFYSLPGGIAGWHEAPRANAVREAREEVGIALQSDSLTPVLDSPEAARLTREHVTLFATRLDAAPPLRTDPGELAWAGFVDLDDPRTELLWPPFRAYVLARRAAAAGAS